MRFEIVLGVTSKQIGIGCEEAGHVSGNGDLPFVFRKNPGNRESRGVEAKADSVGAGNITVFLQNLKTGARLRILNEK